MVLQERASLLRAQTSKGRSLSVISHSTRPPLSAQRTSLVARTLSFMPFGFKQDRGGMLSVPHWGSLHYLDARVETANAKASLFSSWLEQASSPKQEELLSPHKNSAVHDRQRVV